MTNDKLVRDWLATGKYPPVCPVLKTYYCLGSSESCGIKEMSQAYVCGASMFKSQYHKRMNELNKR